MADDSTEIVNQYDVIIFLIPKLHLFHYLDKSQYNVWHIIQVHEIYNMSRVNEYLRVSFSQAL